MRIDFNKLPAMTIPGMNNGTGEMTARMHADDRFRFIHCRLHPGCSIGLHCHDNGDDINYVLSGTGVALCNGIEEPLMPGICHVCSKGSEHSISNTGFEDLVLLTIVVSRQEDA